MNNEGPSRVDIGVNKFPRAIKRKSMFNKNGKKIAQVPKSKREARVQLTEVEEKSFMPKSSHCRPSLSTRQPK